MFDESKVCGLIKGRDLVGAFRYYDSLSDDDYTPDAMVLFAILNVASKEYMNGEKFTILDVSDEAEAWRMHFHSIKFLIRRLEFPHLKDARYELFSYRDEFGVSETAIDTIMRYSSVDYDKVSALYKELEAEYKRGVADE